MSEPRPSARRFEVRIAEVAWNQGDSLYNSLDSRLLTGFEYMARYNVSQVQSYPDQATPWEPTGADFIQRLDRTGRWFSKQINPYFEGDFTSVSRGDFAGKRPVFEQPLAAGVQTLRLQFSGTPEGAELATLVVQAPCGATSLDSRATSGMNSASRDRFSLHGLQVLDRSGAS